MPAPEGSVEEALQDAEAAAEAGDPQAAAAIYGEVLAQEPANVAALAGLARLQAEAGALDHARDTLARVAADKREDAAVKAVQAILDLADQAKSLGPVAELEQRVASDPADHQARFDLALALNAGGQRAEAAQHLVEIVKRARGWNDDSARKQLLQFFEAWGPTDEATVEGRRKLSSVLFA
jgi:putative thioredoxin